MLRKDQIDEALRRAGVSETDAQKMIDSGLGTIFDKIADGVRQQADEFTTEFREYIGGETAEAAFTLATSHFWETKYSHFMSRKVYDAFVRVVRDRLRPGTKEGHFRSPTIKDMLVGRSGDALQDLMVVLFSETQEKWKEQHEQSDRGSGKSG